jgi:TolB-like protein
LRDIGDARIELEEAGAGSDLPARTIDVVAAAAASAAPASLSTAPTLPPFAAATMPGPIFSPPPSGKGWKIALVAGLAVLLLIGVSLGLWLSGVFSSGEDRTGHGRTGGEMIFDIRPDGVKVTGPDGETGGIRFRFPNMGDFSHIPDIGDFMGGPTRTDGTDSLAIVPYGTGGGFGDSPMDKLADRLASGINARLSGTGGLKVKAHADAVRQRHLGDNPRMAGKFLEVNKVLVISVSSVKETFVVTVDLVDVTEGTQLWRQTFTTWQSEDQLIRLIADHVQEKLVGTFKK